MRKKRAKKKKKIIKNVTVLEKEKKAQITEITSILKKMDFVNLSNIENKQFVYDGRTTEMDGMFCYENIVLITEYTVGQPGKHLLNKKVFYDKVLHDKRSFIEYLIKEPILKSFGKYYEVNIKDKYTINQIQLKILYCSKQSISQEHKELNDELVFFDYHIVKYFLSLTNTIKKSAKYEFFDFLRIPFKKVAENIKSSSKGDSNKFSGHILPEEKSSFKEGYKIVSFYIDAESLLKRAFVLRQDAWRKKENVGYYQRMLSSKKINSMRKYLTEKNRVFINNIITSIASNKIKLYDNNENELKIQKNGQFEGNDSFEVTPASIVINDECNIIGIIDGQHRTFAYYEGDDIYEKKIKEYRKIQNLLVTGILFPASVSEESRLKFEANLFLEINSNQTKASPQTIQEIELMISPFSSIAIAKRILEGLNKSGPLGNLIEEYWYETGKIKTASIVSFGLKPLIKIEDIKAKDSLFIIWQNGEKNKLKSKENEEFKLLKEYIDFCVTKIRDLLIAFKVILDDQWQTYSPGTPSGILTVTFVNGLLNVLRLLIENNKVDTIENYKLKIKEIKGFDFKKYKSSQYRKMGQEIYNRYFK